MNNSQLKTTIAKIVSRGYWKLIIEPVEKKEIALDHIRDAKKLVQESSIQLRGWDYPHIPTKNDSNEGVIVQESRVDGFTEWNHFKEAWSFFSSGQFVHILGLREDWFKESEWFEEGSNFKNTEPNTVLDFVGTTLTLTEMLLFIKNMINKVDYGDSVKVSISLHNMNGRFLTTFDPGRLPFFFHYSCTADVIYALKDSVLSKKDLENDCLEISEKAAVKVFKFFGDFDPPVQVIKDDQKKFIERRL